MNEFVTEGRKQGKIEGKKEGRSGRRNCINQKRFQAKNSIKVIFVIYVTLTTNRAIQILI